MWELAIAAVLLLLTLFVGAKLLQERRPPPAPPPIEPPRKRRETPEQFVARMIAEQEARDPADWWKRGEPPAEWEP